MVASVNQQARFPDFRLKRAASRPSQSRKEISDHMWKLRNCRYTVAGTVRVLHPLPLSPSMGTCDGQPESF